MNSNFNYPVPVIQNELWGPDIRIRIRFLITPICLTSRGDRQLVQGGRMIITKMEQIVPTYFDVWRFLFSKKCSCKNCLYVYVFHINFAVVSYCQAQPKSQLSLAKMAIYMEYMELVCYLNCNRRQGQGQGTLLSSTIGISL